MTRSHRAHYDVIVIYVTFNGGFHTERNSDAETVSTISWRHHGYKSYHTFHEDIIGTFVKCGGHLTVEQHPRDIRCAGFSKARKRINLKLLEVNRVRYIWLPRSLPGIIQINNMLNNSALQWRHSGRDGVSNNQPNDCLLNRLFSADQRKHQSSASLVFWGELTGEFPAQRASTAENISIWWRQHGLFYNSGCVDTAISSVLLQHMEAWGLRY